MSHSKLHAHIRVSAEAFNQAITEEQVKQAETNLVLALLQQFPEAHFLTQDVVISPDRGFSRNNPSLLQNRMKGLVQIEFGIYAAEFERTMTSMINHAKNVALYHYLEEKDRTTLEHYQTYLKRLGIVDQFTKTDQEVQNRQTFLKQVYADPVKIGKVGYLTLVNDLFKVAKLAQDFPGKEHDQAAACAIQSDLVAKYFPSLTTPAELAEIKMLLKANEFATLAQINQGEAPALGLQGLWEIIALDRMDLAHVTVMEQLLDISGTATSTNGPAYMVIVPLERSLSNLLTILKETAKNIPASYPDQYQVVYNTFLERKYPQGATPKDIIEARFMAMIRLEQKKLNDAMQQLTAFREARASLTEKEEKLLVRLLNPQTNIMIMYAPDFLNTVQMAVSDSSNPQLGVNDSGSNQHPYLVQGYLFALRQMIQFADAAYYLYDQERSISVVNIKDAVVPARQILAYAIAAHQRGQANYTELLRQHSCPITSFSGGSLSLDQFKVLLKEKRTTDIAAFIEQVSKQPKLLEAVQAAMYDVEDPAVIKLLKSTRNATTLYLGTGGGSDPLNAAAFSSIQPAQKELLIGSSRHCPADIQDLVGRGQAQQLYLENENGLVILQGDGVMYQEDSIPSFHTTSKMESSIGMQKIAMLLMNRSLNVFDLSAGSDTDKLVHALAKYLSAYNITTVVGLDTGGDISGLGKLEAQNQAIDAIEGDVKHVVIMDAAITQAHELYGHKVQYTIQVVAPGIDNQTSQQQQQAFIKKYQLILTKLPLSYFKDLYPRTSQQATNRTTRQIAILGKFFGYMTPEQQKALRKYAPIKNKKPHHLETVVQSFGVQKNQPSLHKDFVAILGRIQVQGKTLVYQTQDRGQSKGQYVDLDLATSYITIDHASLKTIIQEIYATTYVRQVLEGHINHINQLEQKSGPEQLSKAYEAAKKYVLSVSSGTTELIHIATANPSKAAMAIIQAIGAEQPFTEQAAKKRS